ncbi:UvrD-helicase domain-containing protein [Treponema sp. OMZ 792]|uniref:UvrD-helicase domain-containing protein n=1 Tax=unclassified Treponema TaxID=2638727 RepID=UPI0020A31097|nr:MULTISPECIES: UvrD-helicase domain-containing protein [unclassified Treponema]UTC75069.1 UvrD-helicase domain-containing protein [Treponema sp. OMZ 792]UTC81465.1 UvrD-helicase domain-containing protein [Treponema sp. OMZ 798]
MNDYIKNIMDSLNENQRNAVTVEKNSVIAAGAGSGKTKVLAARYVYFVVEKGVSVEKIIALTFTEKAAAEMHKRIYNELKKIDHPNAKTAIEKFHLAKISTIDSFCNWIAKTACRNFGISPDFTIDNAESEMLAYRIGLDFFLKMRADKTMQFFLADNGIDDFVAGLFARLLSNYVLISKPIDFKKSLEAQIKYHAEEERKALSECFDVFEFIKENDPSKNFTEEAVSAYSSLSYFPESVKDEAFLKLLPIVDKISKTAKGRGNDAVKEIKEKLKGIYEKLVCIYNFEYSREYLVPFFAMLEELQKEYIYEKKQRGLLTFSDVSQLAVDVLIKDVDLRNFYKNNAEIIMIDEFQDNNSLQRDLLFLIAEKLERSEKSIPSPQELCPNKLFFVGDEKQSIYAFRGADVSVFRKLADDISDKERLAATRLLINYRTEPSLINLFNTIFSKVFYSEINRPLEKESSVPAYEAEYVPTETRAPIKEVEPKIEIMFFDKKRFNALEDSSEFLNPVETEAFYLAKRILELHNQGFKIRDGKNARPCSWNDFAVLLRASTKQSVYERVFRNLSIPYRSVQQRGLFNDAPINDIYAMLKIIAYPSDKKTYAQVLHSPFVNIDDDAFAVLLLNFTRAFDSPLAEKLNGKNKEAYLRGCGLFARLNELVLTMTSAELVTYLWYDEAYRYFLLTNEENHHYIDLYDYLFELACQADINGLTFSQFVDSLASHIEDNERLDDMELPLDDEKDSVRFLTVHKSKGLEFPIVIVPDCGNRGIPEKKEGLVFYNEDMGPVLYSPNAYCLSAKPGNLIFESLRDEANAKLVAETKRLLYVAATRAESYLIMSGVYNYLQDEDSTNKDSEYSSENPRSLEDIKAMLKISDKTISFFELLLPALPNEHKDIIFNEILPIERQNLFNNLKKERREKINFQKLFASYKVKEFNLAEKRIMTATGLAHEVNKKRGEESVYSFISEKDKLPNSSKNMDEQKEFTAAELGTLAHSLIEARLLNKEFVYPKGYSETERKKIYAWADNFFNSDMYALVKDAEYLKSEYGFLTEYEGQLVSGQIDLLFKKEKAVYVVDYKTDEIENPEAHLTQLKIYKKAAFDLTKTEVKTFIFYLKTGHCVELETDNEYLHKFPM